KRRVPAGAVAGEIREKGPTRVQSRRRQTAVPDPSTEPAFRRRRGPARRAANAPPASEAVHLGDLLRIWVRPGARFTPSPRIFKGQRELTGRRRNRDAFQGAGPSLGANPFQGSPALHKEKRTLPGAPASFSGIVCVAALDASRRLSPPLQIRGSEPDSLSIGRGRRSALRTVRPGRTVAPGAGGGPVPS
uniref:Uncharacterized protein n=1 Tax=Scophthalmus maximus TaxID=52904 RepID=A0A8D3E5B5_SCOMX